jgi:hypothetical protein
MEHEPHIQRELEFPAAALLGRKNQSVKRLQEWLTLSGFGTAIDDDFGPATLEALRRFQVRQGHEANGVLSEADWAILTAPLRSACAAPGQEQFLPRLRALIQHHAKLRGREVGGENSGPWVRLYMRGRDGADQLWCAGFVSFLLRQAALNCGDPLAQPWSDYHEVSCDQLAADGKARQRFLRHSQALSTLGQSPDALNLAVFLVRKTSTDWTHTGLALNTTIDKGAVRFDTIEGNTNDGGSNNGIEVATRIRAGKHFDFVRLE